jgi:CRISPR/Cas system CSM-associated protein Csm3 (group 7 of RAMP superfamily)
MSKKKVKKPRHSHSGPPPAAAGNPRIRYRITGELLLLSALHVGTGATRPLGPAPPGSNERGPDVATIARDHRHQPYLPGTTLKGLLRRIGEAVLKPPDLVRALFGEIKGDDSGAMGAVLVRGATLKTPGEAAGMPYTALPDSGLGKGEFIAARTSIDRASGTAAHNRLFFAEMLAPGAQFAFSLLLEVRRARDQSPAQAAASATERLNALLLVLGTLSGTDGWPVGRGQADGQGRVRLNAKPAIERMEIKTDGRIHYETITVALPSAKRPEPVGQWQITLHCEGPFMIADSSHRRLENDKDRDDLVKKDAADPAAAQLSAQRSGEREPLVPGPSLMGALRTRAEWLNALAHHRASPGGKPGAAHASLAEAGDDPNNLAPVERLFGVTGFRGLLALEALKVDKAEPWTLTSVRLDRFSGAPLDQALFASAGFIDVNLHVTLALVGRRSAAGGEVVPDAQDIALMQALLNDLRDNGLLLGHAINRGFGWFTCTAIKGGINA